MNNTPTLDWTEDGRPVTARWRSEAGVTPPRRVEVVDDTITADDAYHLACGGTALLYRGDYQNARQLMQAMARRADRPPHRPRRKAAAKDTQTGVNPADAFHKHRMAQAQRARILGMVLIPLDADYGIPLRRAPDVREACTEVWGVPDGAPSVASLREILGLVGAHEWRKKGVTIPALGASIHPWYGVFSPVRGEYLQLIEQAPLPSTSLAFDVGTGTGVIAALLARRGVQQVVGTDRDPRALACARENISRLGYERSVKIVDADLFPEGKAPLIVCNPPWLPAKANAPIEHAIYDPESQMLKGFLNGLVAHLSPGGEGWLILSDLAEHLGLRTRETLLSWIHGAGLVVLARHDVRPHHPKAGDANDPLHAARRAEVTSLWRLGVRPA
ncbi:methyltransferase [Pandoraea communis]|uniref:Methylase n=1 Tax=Pandoraea communis TaxID=2508297 RepID=A0A5E4VS47_9BURK|nr:class I SAM-dependent methyltransferase [Pandoraea communis]MDM8357620.1 class I SAM-dependent methyltransferase [Pandoraea communis]VVE14316.1 methylase [Pandoraea communis]